jgi:uncharacterized membrane protein YphA (DoxX/SURF4 family)
MNRFSTPGAALLFLRVTACVLVLLVHGLPKAIHYASQLDAIEDPLHFGKALTLGFAIFVEVVCPLLMKAGIATRLAALPIMLVASCIANGRWTRGNSRGGCRSCSERSPLAVRGATGLGFGRMRPGKCAQHVRIGP